MVSPGDQLEQREIMDVMVDLDHVVKKVSQAPQVFQEIMATLEIPVELGKRVIVVTREFLANKDPEVMQHHKVKMHKLDQLEFPVTEDQQENQVQKLIFQRDISSS